jgi:mono/diheme cytochrome c family protein
LTPFVAALVLKGDPVVDKHVQGLQKSPSLTLKLVLTPVGGAPEEQTLTLSKPNFFKWDSPSKSACSDGTTIWAYDKVKKVFSKTAYSDAAAIKALGGNDIAWTWSAFFNPTFADQLTSIKKGSSHKVRGVAVTDITVTRKDERVFTLYIDDATGIARGAGYTVPESKTEMIVFAKESTLGDKSLGGDTFAWAPPEGAKDAATLPLEAAANALTYASIKPILDRNCAGCHGGPNPKRGIDLSNYSGAASQTKPGNPDGSKMMRVIRNGQMPPNNPLGKDAADQLAKWIADGSKE